MFEQSILANKRASKPWTLVISFAAQLAMITVLCLVPLIYTEQLHGLTKWAEKIMLPPAAAPLSEPPNTVQQQRPPAKMPLFRAPLSIPRQVANLHENPEQRPLDAPSGPVVVGAVDYGASPISDLLRTMSPIARPPDRPPVVEPPKPPTPAAAMRVSQGVQEAKLLRKVIPVYPPLAITARVEGTVRLVGVIARDGTIRDLQVTSGHPLLVRAALDAVRQWVYKPTLLSGEPVEVIAPISVTFTLGR